MKFYSIDKEKKKLRKVILKNVESIDFDNHKLEGIVTITNVRFYKHDYFPENLCQVDIKFEGNFKLCWQQTYYKRRGLYVKRGVNQIFRFQFRNDIESFLRMFSIDNRDYKIKVDKINWV